MIGHCQDSYSSSSIEQFFYIRDAAWKQVGPSKHEEILIESVTDLDYLIIVVDLVLDVHSVGLAWKGRVHYGILFFNLKLKHSHKNTCYLLPS